MKVFQKWVKKCFQDIVDPDKDAEVEDLSKLLYQNIQQRKQAFVLSDVIEGRSYKRRHLDEARLVVYRTLLTRAWSDGRVQPAERETLAWVAKCLEIPSETVRAVNVTQARGRFAEVLAEAMDDGEITAEEAKSLNEIAAAAGLTLPQFMKEFFRGEGEAFLRGIFAAAVADNRLKAGALDQLYATAGRLGIARSEVLSAIQPQAARFIEHVLADAKEDGILTDDEEATLEGLLQQFELPNETRDYVVAELHELRQVTRIRQGKLPSMPAPTGMNLRAGELVRYHGRAMWEQTRIKKSGPANVYHDGLLTITDSRLIFSAETRSQAISLQRIVAFDVSLGAIEVQVHGKPTDRFLFHGPSRIPCAIFRSALAMANQTLTSRDDTQRSRHIPRDVRQRVWQRYGGQCADCRATSYLEFDHIVPVAKGGSNSDANVQLLCRNCNLKKSDMI